MVLAHLVVIFTSEHDDTTLNRAARLSVAANRRAAAQLRRQAPRPYGLAPGMPQPPPASVTSDIDLTPLRMVRAFLTRSQVPVATVTLTYGMSRDLATDLIAITTDYTRRHHGACPLEYELGLAEYRDAAIARDDKIICGRPVDAPDGPFGHLTTPIVVDGERRDAEMLTDGRYHALRFEQASLLVTVVSRNQLPERPAFSRVTDLEPLLASSANDLEIVHAAWRIIHEAHMDAGGRDRAADDC